MTPEDHFDADQAPTSPAADPGAGDELRLLSQSEHAVATMFQLLADAEEDPARAQRYRRRAIHALREAARAQRTAAFLEGPATTDRGRSPPHDDATTE